MFLKKFAPSQIWRFCLLLRQNSHFFGVRTLKDVKLILKNASKSPRKLKHANSIRQSFEHICQTSSKLILIILSYTYSKFVRFFLRHSV